MPLLVRGGGGVGGGVAFLCCFLALGLDSGCLRLLPACAVPGLSGVGFCEPPCPECLAPGWGEVLLVVVVGVEEPEEEEDEPDLEPDDGFGLGVLDVEVEVEVEVVCDWVVLVVTVTAGVVAVTGGQDCETLVIGRLTGSGSELGGVPGATFWNVNV
jgi:hypothetical protein